MVSNTPFPPGSLLEPGGVRFTLFSESATRIDLCLFESSSDKGESQRIPLQRDSQGWWSALVPQASVGCLYGFRVHGRYDPPQGQFFNPNKIVIDPYAFALGRAAEWDTRIFGHDPDQPGSPDPRDNADIAPLGRVIDPEFDWEDDRPPGTPWQDTLIYETHVKSLTALHPEVPESLRGSYLGLTAEPIINHLKDLGVTAVELLPVHQAFDEWHCRRNGLVNFWGYNTLLPFAPDRRFARTFPDDPAREFKTMVKALHRAGLEVILDVVYNHTPEGGAQGPTLNYRGIDNTTYYRLDEKELSSYENFTGCGNTWNMEHPVARQLVLDSLRFWVEEMHVDGFRFDLATTLGRSPKGFNREHPFFESIENDPILSHVKLIAEPWDLGEGGYQLAHFPKAFSEWNDQYRNGVRQFWRGDAHQLGLMARRLAGSEDIFGPQDRPPRSTLNYITCHDGFTLQDLISYETKHNQANGENNRDGNNQNHSRNFGEEGPTLDPQIREIRLRQKRNLMATLFVSLGTPMLLGGDELGKTQWGNNNAWCQDNDINYYNWELKPEQDAFRKFVAELSKIRREHPALRRTHFFSGKKFGQEKDLTWLHPEGREMKGDDWSDQTLHTLGARIRNEQVQGSPSLLLLFHASEKFGVPFEIPAAPKGLAWKTLIDTFNPEAPQHSGKTFNLQPLSMAILELRPRNK